MPPSVRDENGWYIIMFLPSIWLISCWDLASRLRLKRPKHYLCCRHHMYVWSQVWWSCCPPTCVLVCLLLQSSVYLPTVLRCCFRAFIHFVRSAARHSHRPLYIAGDGGQWFFSPMPAHHRGCLLLHHNPQSPELPAHLTIWSGSEVHRIGPVIKTASTRYLF